MDFDGPALRKMRKDKGLTQVELSKLTKTISVKKISEIENSKYIPTDEQIELIVSFLAPENDKTANGQVNESAQSATNTYVVYTDGGCLKNPGGRGGYGIVIIDLDSGKRKELSGAYESSTNNRMEMIAAIVALESLAEGATVTLKSDSQYLVHTMNGLFRRTKNTDLWERLDKASRGKHVKYEWIRGHAKNANNNRCDALATRAMSQNRDLSVDSGFLERTPHAAPAKSTGGAMGVGLSSLDDQCDAAGNSERSKLSVEEYADTYKVSVRCAILILNFLNSDDRSFKSYARLKTGGMDSWSGKGEEYLVQIVGRETWNRVMAILQDRKSTEACFRWHCRGLSIKDSVRKVLVEKEISKNALQNNLRR